MVFPGKYHFVESLVESSGAWILVLPVAIVIVALIRDKSSSRQIVALFAHFMILCFAFVSASREVWIGCLALIALISLYAWGALLLRRRAIIDAPASRIASAAQGYVKLSGIGRPLDDSPLSSPLTSLPCLWYRYRLEEKNGSQWETTASDESGTPFIIEDGGERCVVDVEGAEILTRHEESWGGESYRKTEWKLLINDRIHVLGEFRTLGGGSADLDARRDQNELLSEWKRDRVALLKRFDLDGDGELDAKEWELARQAARREVSRMHREAREASDVHTLSRPRDGRRYLLSNIDPAQLARRHWRWSLVHLIIFLTALGAMPWMFQRFG
jgi:hypothetical protein